MIWVWFSGISMTFGFGGYWCLLFLVGILGCGFAVFGFGSFVYRGFLDLELVVV